MATLADLFPDGTDPGGPGAAPLPRGRSLKTLTAPLGEAPVLPVVQLGVDLGAPEGDRSVVRECDVVDEQALALSICRTEPFVNLSGTAGVGKTTVARQLAADPGVVLAATTGIASINLGEGTTINALLRYFDTDSLKEMHLHGTLAARLRGLRRTGTRTIVLDEKSMLNGDQLTYLVRALDEVNQTSTYDADLDSSELSDTMRLILVGDFGQLPPVPDTDPVTQKKCAVKFAFDSPEWGRFADHTVTLQRIRRQDSAPFIAALHAVRRGDKAAALDFFPPARFHAAMDDSFSGTTIFAKNDAVERYNALHLDVLHTPALSFPSPVTGKPRGDWKLIPEVLRLKEGALVMVLANRRVYADKEDETGELLYANGDLGTLLGAYAVAGGGWSVQLHRGPVVQVLPITRHHVIPLEVGRRKELVALYGKEGAEARIDGRKEIIGAVSYMPLRCAYGCTVHKTQGLTLDRVQVNIRDPFFRQPGMLFVALSRARTAEGVRLVGDVRGFGERCTVDARVQRWR